MRTERSVDARLTDTPLRGAAFVLLVVPLVVANFSSEPPPPSASVTGELSRSGVAEAHLTSAGRTDAATLLEQAEMAMIALDSFEQHVYSTGPLDWAGDEATPVWQLWDTEYRHECPDRLRIVVRTAWVGQGFVNRTPSIGIHIGEHAWARDLPSTEDGPWSCSGGGVTEMPRFTFAPVAGETSEYLGLERIGARTAHVVSITRPAI